MKHKLPHCNFRIVLQSKCKLINFFTFKDKIPIFLRSGIVYKFKCCNAAYYGKTKGYFKVKMGEHLGFSSLTGKRVKRDNDSSILAGNNNDFKVTLMESFVINRYHPPLNKNRHSLPLEVFDD